MGKIRFIEVISEYGSNKPGASLGIRALQFAYSQLYNTKLYDRHNFSTIEPVRLASKEQFPYAKSIDIILNVHKNISDEIKNCILAGEIPIVISGDHSSGAAVLAGIKSATKQENIAVVWIDAHADAHSPYTTPSGNLHGMPIGILLGEDNLEEQINSISIEEEEMWNRIKYPIDNSAIIKPNDLLYIGVRSTEPAEEKLINRLNIRNFTVDILRNNTKSNRLKLFERALKDFENIFISFDADAICSSIIQGSGTPEPNGLTIVEVMEVIEILFSLKKVVCFEFCEINPLEDNQNNTAKKIAPILNQVIQHLENN